MKIGIAGAGGIGSNVAVHLARSGVNYMKIADFDTVSESNLNRQFYFRDQVGLVKVEALKTNLLRINPALELDMLNVRLTPENICDIYSDCGIIVEAFDRADQKAMLIEAFGGNKDRLVVSACGLAGLRMDKIGERNVCGNVTIFGDFESDVRKMKLYSPKVLAVASLMAGWILGKLEYKDE